ncbi:MAG: 30S ribosomal protein S4 [Candidatus Omnitrophica bacterium]|nr:30S ribosomal protein S4 [Candidatus Omnitrophota bacterium]
MARYTGPKCRLCRREGISICLCKKCAVDVRESAPGQHGAMRKVKLSDYGLQLREKQKVKRLYGLLEKQFRLCYEKASRSKGVTGHVLLQLLERRLDNVVFRLGIGTTRPQARQFVAHGLVCVNGSKLSIPSAIVNQGDEITFKLKETTKKYIKENIERLKEKPKVAWVKLDETTMTGKVLRLPERDDVGFPINEQLIIELYSK